MCISEQTKKIFKNITRIEINCYPLNYILYHILVEEIFFYAVREKFFLNKPSD